MKIEDREFYSMRDVANLFGVSLSHVKQTVRWELGDPIKVGKRCLRWSKDQIKAYVKNNEIEV
jgi:hypothetical protein